MIFDTLDHWQTYFGANETFSRAFHYLAEHDLSSMAPGRYDIEGDKLYALVQEYTTKLPEQGKWEAHKRYIDVQYVDSGQERIGFANIHTMEPGEYMAEKDFQALTGTGNNVTVFPGAFVAFFPEDAHMPGLCVDSPAPVRKIVIKIRIEE